MDQGSDAVVEVANTFRDIARELQGQPDVQQTLEKVVELAVEHLECDAASISYVEGRSITCPASSGSAARRVTDIQAEVDEGPCLDAIKDNDVYLTGDLTKEHRWPHFAARSFEETGILSILSVRLFTQEVMGSLNLYSSQRDAFDDTDIALAAVFATHAAIAMTSAQREERFQRGLASRDVIGRAKGILIAREGITDEQAFDVLRRASQRLNVKLTKVAQQVTEAGGGVSDPTHLGHASPPPAPPPPE